MVKTLFARPDGFVMNLRVELKEQPFAPTLAYKLGGVPYVSGLLRRIVLLRGAGNRVSEGRRQLL